jgi:hypothetical protein
LETRRKEFSRKEPKNGSNIFGVKMSFLRSAR